MNHKYTITDNSAGTIDYYPQVITTSPEHIYYEYGYGYGGDNNWNYNQCSNDKIIEELKKYFDKQNQENKEEIKSMNVYEIIIVDKRECEIILTKKIIAKDTETAMLDLDLDSEVKKKVKKDEIQFIFVKKGSFEPITDEKE